MADDNFHRRIIFTDEYFLPTKISKLYYSAIILAVDRKFKGVLGLNQIYYEFIVCGIQLIQGNNEKRRNLLKRQAVQGGSLKKCSHVEY